ncbi:hypothetical protein BVRB_029450, partial [Beta vulgaris subsp. vulgaris]
ITVMLGGWRKPARPAVRLVHQADSQRLLLARNAQLEP